MKYPKHPGVYAIRHVDSRWAYIGSSRNIYSRWRTHKSELRRGKHPCPHLQNAWNKYGESAFQFEVLESCFDDPVILMSLEQNWLDRCTAKLYNAARFADPATGRKMSEESKRRNSIRMMGNKHGAGSYYHGVLEEFDVKVILHRYASGHPCREIAADFKVSVTNIRRIAKRQIWCHVPIPDDVESARLARSKTRDNGRSVKARKVSWEDIQEIRLLGSSGVRSKDIAEKFGISQGYARGIITGKVGVKHIDIIDCLTAPEAPEEPQLKPMKKSYRVRKNPLPPRPKLPRAILICGNCGKEFSRPSCHMKRASKQYYCSIPCRNAKARERTVAVMADPAIRAKLADAQRGKKLSAETRAKMSAAQFTRADRERRAKSENAQN